MDAKKTERGKEGGDRQAKKAEMDAKTDWDRMESEPDPRDPRTLTTMFPCYGEHTMPWNWAGNASGRWKDCVYCGLRLQYVPLRGASGEHRTPGPLPVCVTEALVEVKHWYKPGAITAKIIKEEIRKAEALHGARVWRNRLIMNREFKEMSQSKADEVSMTNVPAAEENVSAASASSTTLTPTTVVQFRRHTGGTVPRTAGDSSSDESWTPLESLLDDQ